jgi:hypothetical protein
MMITDTLLDCYDEDISAEKEFFHDMCESFRSFSRVEVSLKNKIRITGKFSSLSGICDARFNSTTPTLPNWGGRLELLNFGALEFLALTKVLELFIFIFSLFISNCSLFTMD